MKKLYIILMIVIFAISCAEKSDLPIIGIVQLTEDPVLDEAREAAILALKNAGFEDGKNIKIDYKNAQGDLSNVVMILQSFQSENAKLILTNTTPCMSSAAAVIKDIPIVFTVSFGPQQIGIDAPMNLNGYYDPLKMDKFVSLMMSCVPDIKVIGLPYNPSEANAEYASKQLVEECKKYDIQVILKGVNSPNDIIPAVQYLTSQGVDALVVAADNTTYLGLETICQIAEYKKIPVFVTDPYQAKKGATFGYGLNYEEWGRSSGELAAKILKDDSNKKSQIYSLDRYQLIINKNAAKKQGVNIPEDVMLKADLVIE